jgi:replicative DNA helicase
MQEEVAASIRFTSGFESIDNAINGCGPSAGEIYAWLGLPGTGKSLALVTGAVKNISRLGKRVLYVSLEMDEFKIAERFDAQFSKVNIGELQDHKDIVFKALEEQVHNKEDKRLLVIKQFPSGSLDVNKLQAYVQQLGVEGFHPDLVVVDYIGEMKDVPGIPTWESRFRMIRDLRGFAIEEKLCVFTALQPNKAAREAQKVSVIDDDNLADAFGQARPLDGLWSINQMQAEKEANIARIFVVKHRNGKGRFQFEIEYDPDTLQMIEITTNAYETRYKKHQHDKAVDKVEDKVSDNIRNKSKSALSETGSRFSKGLEAAGLSNSKKLSEEQDDDGEVEPEFMTKGEK